MNAIQSPIRQILTNAGVENVDKVLAPINFEMVMTQGKNVTVTY